MSAPEKDDRLRIVLFGLPRAGKSALLAGLSQGQDRLEDPSGGLARQRQLHYDELPRTTEDETVSYPLKLPTAEGLLDVELIDCDGRVVLEMLKKREPIENLPGDLPRVLLNADALVVVNDVMLKPELTDKVLAAFHDFLQRHERTRGKQSDVAGLPVYVVLTKCDLLAEPTDGFSTWMTRIEDQKRRAYRRLQDFLDDAKQERSRSFGRLDVHLWATALRRPALGSTAARPRDPYNVAELFRACVVEANHYRGRRAVAHQRLRLSLFGLGGLAAAMMLLAGILVSGMGERNPDELQRRVERYQSLEGATLTDRLHDWPDDLKDRLAELSDIHDDPGFDSLPEKMRDYVVHRRDELNEYVPYLEKVISPRFSAPARTETELRKREQVLERDLKLPHDTWEDSGAGRLRHRRLADIVELRSRAELAVSWYQELQRTGDDLAKFRRPATIGETIDWPAWQDAVDAYIRDTTKPPPAATDELKADSLITPVAVQRFDKVRSAREAVLGPDAGRRGRPGVVQSLETMRDIAAVLGLIRSTPTRPDLLNVPRPPDLTAKEARARLLRLESHPVLAVSFAGLAVNPSGFGFPSAAATFGPGHPFVPPYFDYEAEFRLANVPTAARNAVEQRARAGCKDVLDPIQDIVRRLLETERGEGDETPAHWRAVADRLAANPPEVRDYRRLAVLLDRLRRIEAEDPVAALVAFLKTTEFKTDATTAFVTIPFRLDVGVPDGAQLVVRSGPREYVFRHVPERRRTDKDARTTTFQFDGVNAMVFRPGETCSASLNLYDDGSVKWNESRTRTYSFECLGRPAKLYRKNAPLGSPAGGVVLTVEAKPGLPTVPELLPEIRASAPPP